MTRFAGIIGHPVAHSLSPVFQRAAFQASGLDITYDLWDTLPESLSGRIVSLRDPKYLGANVTIPHKEAVIPLLDELGGQSARVGAVNTIVNRGGRAFGFNTDGPGFVAALRNEAMWDPAGKSILLLGAGGAARGIAFALAESRARMIGIWNRTPERAARLAADVSATGATAVHEQPSPARDGSQPVLDPGGYDCVVNCTSVGMHGGGAEESSPCDLARARPGSLAVDIVYAPEHTPFLQQAEDHGLKILGGLPMLIHQGALAFELWTGVNAPIGVMLDAARAELGRREAAPPTSGDMT